MKVKKRAIIIAVICLIVLIGGFVINSILGKSYFKELEYDDVIDKIENKEDFILLVSQTGCTHCISYKPKLKEVAKEHKVYVYYIDVDLLNEDEYNEFKSYVNFSSTPVTVFLKEGEENSAATRINGDASREKILRKLKSNGFID